MLVTSRNRTASGGDGVCTSEQAAPWWNHATGKISTGVCNQKVRGFQVCMVATSTELAFRKEASERMLPQHLHFRHVHCVAEPECAFGCKGDSPPDPILMATLVFLGVVLIHSAILRCRVSCQAPHLQVGNQLSWQARLKLWNYLP